MAAAGTPEYGDHHRTPIQLAGVYDLASRKKRRAEAVNQWGVRNETNGEREPPAVVGAPKGDNLANAAWSRHYEKPVLWAFSGYFGGPVKRVNSFP